jgi:hypothetical protein
MYFKITTLLFMSYLSIQNFTLKFVQVCPKLDKLVYHVTVGLWLIRCFREIPKIHFTTCDCEIREGPFFSRLRYWFKKFNFDITFGNYQWSPLLRNFHKMATASFQSNNQNITTSWETLFTAHSCISSIGCSGNVHLTDISYKAHFMRNAALIEQSLKYLLE